MKNHYYIGTYKWILACVSAAVFGTLREVTRSILITYIKSNFTQSRSSLDYNTSVLKSCYEAVEREIPICVIDSLVGEGGSGIERLFRDVLYPQLRLLKDPAGTIYKEWPQPSEERVVQDFDRRYLLHLVLHMAKDPLPKFMNMETSNKFDAAIFDTHVRQMLYEDHTFGNWDEATLALIIELSQFIRTHVNPSKAITIETLSKKIDFSDLHGSTKRFIEKQSRKIK